MTPEHAIAPLCAAARGGSAVLFTGAGFSRGARDRQGRALPTSEELRQELWVLAFGDEPIDGSSLVDLYDAALLRRRDQVVALLQERLSVGATPLPDHYRIWLSLPWRRVYTLNVDDLEVAAQRQFQLPRPLCSCSALAGEPPPPRPDRLDVVHLNGMVAVDAERVTFATSQYAERLGNRQPAYEHLDRDLSEATFVFVGTTLDEMTFWQQLFRERWRGARRAAGSFLVTQRLPRARQVLLEGLGMVWLPTTAEALAEALAG
jgi:hypothetical protein